MVFSRAVSSPPYPLPSTSMCRTKTGHTFLMAVSACCWLSYEPSDSMSKFVTYARMSTSSELATDTRANCLSALTRTCASYERYSGRSSLCHLVSLPCSPRRNDGFLRPWSDFSAPMMQNSIIRRRATYGSSYGPKVQMVLCYLRQSRHPGHTTGQ
jgi:hypothetical protein